MVHRPDHRSLQADKITRQAVVEDLPAPVFQRLVTKRPPAEQREELRAVRTLGEDHRPSLGNQLATLECGDKFQLVRREGPELGHRAEWTLLAGDTSGGEWQNDAHVLETPRYSPIRMKTPTDMLELHP